MVDLFPAGSPYAAYLKFAIPALAILLIVVHGCFGSRRLKAPRAIVAALFFLSAVLAMNEYVRGNLRDGLWLNGYEFYHYYIGAKYERELGYTNMYNATLAADAEAKRRMVKQVRDLDSGRVVAARQQLKGREAHKTLFSEARWKEFATDVAFFRERVSFGQWQQQLRDKGYNGTPAWTMLGSAFATLVPTGSRSGMQALVLIDVFLVVAAFACTWRAFGHRSACLLIVFLGAHYLMSHNTLRAAFIRLDWIACLVMSISMLKLGHDRTAGALAAWAAISRIFPAIFLYGIVAKLAYDAAVSRTINRRCINFLGAFVVAFAVFLFYSAVVTGGFGSWIEFFDKVGRHNQDISAWRIGFKYVFLMTFENQNYWGVDAKTFFDSHQIIWWSIQLTVLGACFMATRRLELHEAFAFGFVPAYFFFSPTFYYYVFLLVPIQFFAGRMNRPFGAIGLIYVFATGMMGHVFFGWWGRGYKLFFVMSCLMGVLALYMLFVALMQPNRPTAKSAPGEEPDCIDPVTPGVPA